MTTEVTAIVVAPDEAQRAEELPTDDPATPAVGKWYWVAGKSERWLGCIVHVGSNYARLKGTRWARRVHLDQFFEVCTFEPDPDTVIGGFIGTHNRRVGELMEEVKAVTMRLGVGANPLLGVASETQALTLRRDEPMDAYKTALVKAKDETLPELFKQIRSEHAALAKWMKARLIPMRAQAAALKPAIKHVEDRIFSVQLYAGLTEEIAQIADGEPAPLTEKIHLFQRRAYMDEECLAAYETGGMEFKDLRAFDRWIAKPKNRDRLLPLPRCILSFQVRRHRKERHGNTVADYIRFAQLEKMDKYTYLYMRNGEQLFRLATEIRFEHQLFPDLDERELLTSKLWANVSNIETDDEEVRTFRMGGSDDDDDGDDRIDFDGNKIRSLIPDRQYQGMLEDEERAYREWRDVTVPEAKAKIAANKKKPKEEQESEYFLRVPDEPRRHSQNYSVFDRDNVHYDDIANYIQRMVAAHNRLVLVLQGILDRSPVMHPHPPWVLWNGASFEQAIELHYEQSRALTVGDAPDFEVYRARCNALVKVGTLVIGQHALWYASEERAEERERRRRGRYRDIRNPGPGKFAPVAKIGRGGVCRFEWVREHHFYNREDGSQVRKLATRFSAPLAQLFNVEAYTPGDFKQFFTDPRTRAQYLQWAPILLEAEEYHAGNRKDQVRKPEQMPAPRSRTPGGSYEYQERKRKLALIGKAVRLRRNITMMSGIVYKQGTLWRVRYLERGKFSIAGIKPDGSPIKGDEKRHWHISGVREYDFTVDESIPPAPKEKE